jgi:hypothetical protein
MYRKIVPALLFALVLAMAGCKKDSEIEGFIKDLDGLTADMVKAIEASPNSAGIDQAQKLLDAKKAGMKTKLGELKQLRGFQVSQGTLDKLTKSLTDNAQKLGGMSTKIIAESTKTKDFTAGAKFAALVKSYTELYQ